MFASTIEDVSTQQSADVITSQPCSEVTSRKKTTRTHFNWSEPQDDILIPALVDEVVKGGRHCDNGLKPDSIRHVVDKIADATINALKVKNRIRTLKANFLLGKEAIAQSGFNLSEDGRVMANEEVWVQYLQAHPKASTLHGTKVCHYDKLQIIFGNDQATEEFAMEGNDSIPSTPLESIDVDLDESLGVGNETTFVEGEPSHRNAPRTIALPSRRRRLLDVFQRFEMTLNKMADHIDKLAEAFQKLMVLPGVMAALKAIPEFMMEERVHALHLMGTNLSLVDVFFALDEDTHFGWVKSRLV